MRRQQLQLAPRASTTSREIAKTYWLLQLALAVILVATATELVYLVSWATSPAARGTLVVVPVGTVAATTFLAAVFAIGTPSRSPLIAVAVGLLLEGTALAVNRLGCLVGTRHCTQSQLWASPNDLTSLATVIVLLLLLGTGLYAEFRPRRVVAKVGHGAKRATGSAQVPSTVASLGLFAGGLLANVVAFPLEAVGAWQAFDSGERMVARYIVYGLRQTVLMGVVSWTILVLIGLRPIRRGFSLAVSLLAAGSILDLTVDCGWIAAFAADCSSQRGFPPLRTLEAIGIALPSFLVALSVKGARNARREADDK